MKKVLGILEFISNKGLSKMGRKHIHFSEDFPGSKQVISGMRYEISK